MPGQFPLIAPVVKPDLTERRIVGFRYFPGPPAKMVVVQVQNIDALGNVESETTVDVAAPPGAITYIEGVLDTMAVNLKAGLGG